MTFTVRKHINDNYGLNIEDEIDHDYITELDSEEDVKGYLKQLSKECYYDRTYPPMRWSIRYDIFWEDVKEGIFWLDNEPDYD